MLRVLYNAIAAQFEQVKLLLSFLVPWQRLLWPELRGVVSRSYLLIRVYWDIQTNQYVPKYGCSCDSAAVNRSWWSYRNSLSRKSIPSFEMYRWFSEPKSSAPIVVNRPVSTVLTWSDEPGPRFPRVSSKKIVELGIKVYFVSLKADQGISILL